MHTFCVMVSKKVIPKYLSVTGIVPQRASYDSTENKNDDYVVNILQLYIVENYEHKRKLPCVFNIGCTQQESSWVKHGLNSGEESQKRFFYFFQFEAKRPTLGEQRIYWSQWIQVFVPCRCTSRNWPTLAQIAYCDYREQNCKYTWIDNCFESSSQREMTVCSFSPI